MKKITSILIIVMFLSSPSPFHPLYSQAQDGIIDTDALYHDSRDAFYRNPGWGTHHSGAVTIGTDVQLTIRAAKDDLSSASIRIWDGPKGIETIIEMSVSSSDSQYDYWSGTVESPNYPADFYYAFILKDGSSIRWYNDDVLFSVFEDARVYQTGGVGVPRSFHANDGDYSIIFHEDSFSTPDWHKQAVGYQIFIDRFYNGETANDPQSTDICWYEWDSSGDGRLGYGDAERTMIYKHGTWDETPQGGCDYFGGDFQGVLEKSDYLNDLGIDFIWFNPFSESPDNHGYAVNDYRSVDSYYSVVSGRDGGNVINNNAESMAYFDTFADALEEVGIKIIYDTVINHASAQGKYFQRFEGQHIDDNAISGFVPDLYPDILGAYESSESPYYSMFEFYADNHNYNSWFGFNNIPTIMYHDNVAMNELVNGSNNIFKFWIEHGVDGFRLDVNHQYQDGQGSRLVNQMIRDSVKAADPEAVIIGEIWERASAWLAGDMNDAVQNMPFRFNTIDWILGNYDDEQYSNLLYAVQEHYPKEVFESLWVNLGNHDRTRILSALGGSSAKQLMAATMQFTYPGVPVIWYGDEIGTKGVGDPGTRTTYDWSNTNTTILDHYKQLISLKKSVPTLLEGDFQILEDNRAGVLAYQRYTDDDTALIMVNRNDDHKNTIIQLAGTGISAGQQFVDVLNGNWTYTVKDDLSIIIDLPRYGNSILLPISGIITTPDLLTSTGPEDSSLPIIVFPVMLALMPIITKYKSKNQYY
ncbi:MAG: alpha amylase N-terminal ig-like domain-containing protein [Candidatus Heimdallarchaeota archaeon]|nr:alpha amylase N-terminal ig-like domain-containing protein [Candidatus Heimdallarchaeota archaeon]